jgi:hypothetical protein
LRATKAAAAGELSGTGTIRRKITDKHRRISVQAGASAGNFAEKSGPEQIYGRPEKQTRDSGANQGGLSGE